MSQTVIIDNNYCRRCKIFNVSSGQRTNYCNSCNNLMRKDKNAFNRWLSAEIFIKTSFQDCIDDSTWSGFKNIKYKKNLIKKITDRFSVLSYICSIYSSGQIKQPPAYAIYLLRDSKNNLLKVGQTCNPKSRFNKYYNISQNRPVTMDIFSVDMKTVDLYEQKVRNYLEYLGYRLPEDNTGKRLQYINKL